MTLTLEEIESLVERELEGDPELSVEVLRKVVEAVRRAVLSTAAEHVAGADVVLEDASGRVILLEAKMGAGKTEQMISELLKQHTRAAVVTGASASALANAIEGWSRQQGSYREVLEALAPKDRGSLSAAAVLQARRNAQARRRFLEEFPALTSTEVAEAANSRAANRASLANRWRDEGKVFAVRLGDQQLYPAFQFDDQGRPLPVITRVLKRLSEGDLTDWQTALWFTTPTGWLGGARPADLLTAEPDAVTEAAAREVGELVA
jgi:hypothetical protein